MFNNLNKFDYFLRPAEPHHFFHLHRKYQSGHCSSGELLGTSNGQRYPISRGQEAATTRVDEINRSTLSAILCSGGWWGRKKMLHISTNLNLNSYNLSKFYEEINKKCPAEWTKALHDLLQITEVEAELLITFGVTRNKKVNQQDEELMSTKCSQLFTPFYAIIKIKMDIFYTNAVIICESIEYDTVAVHLFQKTLVQ